MRRTKLIGGISLAVLALFGAVIGGMAWGRSSAKPVTTKAPAAPTPKPNPKKLAPTPAPTTTTPSNPQSYAAIAGHYDDDWGTVNIDASGSATFAPGCGNCNRTSPPTLSFSLKTLTSTGSGSYRATGVFTAFSDPSWAQSFSPPLRVGDSMSLTYTGYIDLSFLPNENITRSTPSDNSQPTTPPPTTTPPPPPNENSGHSAQTSPTTGTVTFDGQPLTISASLQDPEPNAMNCHCGMRVAMLTVSATNGGDAAVSLSPSKLVVVPYSTDANGPSVTMVGYDNPQEVAPGNTFQVRYEIGLGGQSQRDTIVTKVQVSVDASNGYGEVTFPISDSVPPDFA
jgi:hypothetical protein